MMTPGRLTALDPWLLVLALSWRLLIFAALVVGIGYGLWRLFRHYGAETILRAVAPLAVVALMLTGCGIGPAGERLVTRPVDWSNYRAPGSSQALASQVATVSGGGVAASTTSELDSALAALERLYESAGLRPCTQAQTLRQRAWCDPPPLSPLPSSWWATYYPALSGWTYRTTVPCEQERRYAVIKIIDGNDVYGLELVAAGAWEDDCWPLGEMVANPQPKAEAAEEHHRHSPRYQKSQCHGMTDALRGLQLLRDRGSVVAPWVGTGGRVDERLSLLVNDCTLGTLGGDVKRALGSDAAAVPCSISGWSSRPLPSACDVWVEDGPAAGCCWQRRWAPRVGLHVLCARSCEGVPDTIPPPPAIVTCPDGVCSQVERASGSCPADCPPVEKPPLPEPPTDKCRAAVDDFEAIFDALAEQAQTVGRECRP